MAPLEWIRRLQEKKKRTYFMEFAKQLKITATYT